MCKILCVDRILQRIRVFVTLICAGVAINCTLAQIPCDTIIVSSDTIQSDTLSLNLSDDEVADSVAFSQLPWWKQVLENGFRIHDPRIKYPKFPKFLLSIYDWGDRTFNSYDKDYVVGVGQNWKVMLKNYNWLETYMLMFAPRSRDMLHLNSNLYSDIGVYLSFMAVSVGYTANINSLAGGTSNDRHNLNLNFTCSRFSANFDYTSTKGNTTITHFGDYSDTHDLSYKFNDISHKSTSGELYYFLNHRRYSQAAAYCFSKYQLKSAGSAILGFAFNHQRINMDFSSLPDEMKDYLPSLASEYRFRYTDYGLLAGYAHNWVLHPRRWLANFTVIPSIGYRHAYSTSTEGSKSMLAANMRVRFAFVYNHRALFASLTGRFDGHMYFNSQYAFFNSIASISLIVGARF